MEWHYRYSVHMPIRLLLALVLLAGCAAPTSTPEPTPLVVYVTPAPTPEPTPEPTPDVHDLAAQLVWIDRASAVLDEVATLADEFWAAPAGSLDEQTIALDIWTAWRVEQSFVETPGPCWAAAHAAWVALVTSEEAVWDTATDQMIAGTFLDYESLNQTDALDAFTAELNVLIDEPCS